MMFAAGHSASKSNGRHGGFSAGADEAEPFNGGIAGDDAFGEIGFCRGRSAKTGGVAGRALNGIDGGREGVTEDHGAPGAEVVDVAIAVGIGKPGALCAREERRRSAHSAEGAHGRVHTAGEKALCTLLKGMGLCVEGLLSERAHNAFSIEAGWLVPCDLAHKPPGSFVGSHGRNRRIESTRRCTASR